MSAGASKAVFLSYASQDAEAARKIAEALRSAGVEVWFDVEGGLEHGDEWDQKIRRQIKECVLFLPLISANTQAREEGYFRIEWELAAERAMGIASGVAFILPIVIDDTREPEALVPDRFRKVQWTRLPGGVVTTEVQARLLKLWSHRVGVITHAGVGATFGSEGSTPATNRDPVPISSRRPWAAIVIPAVLIVGGVACLAWWTGRGTRSVNSGDAVAAAAKSSPTAVRLSEAQQLTQRAYALTQKVGFIRDDLAAAEQMSLKATELEPESARAWGVRAWVHAAYLNRNWDRSVKRREDAQGFANRALALDANEADALNALAQVLTTQGAFADAEKAARRAVAAAPDNTRSRLTLGRSLVFQGNVEEARAVLVDAVRRKPDDVLAHYEMANIYGGLGRISSSVEAIKTAVEHLDAALKIQPFGSAFLLKALMVGPRQGDFAGMRAQLDAMEKLAPADLAEDRAVYIAMWAGLMEGRADRVIATAARTARTYLDDTFVAGPKAWGTALAYQLQGKANTALLEWRAAEAALRKHMREMPGNPLDVVRLATTLAWLGDEEAAAREVASVEGSLKEQLTPFSARALASYYAARGDAGGAVPYLRAAVNRTDFISDYTLAIDPWWQKLRGKPEFEALLTEAKARIASGQGGIASVVAAPVAAAPVSPARELTSKALALIRQLEATREDVSLAEDYCQRAMKLDPTDGEVWAVTSQVHGTYVYRGWDLTAERREQSRMTAERAIRIAPKSVEARLAQAGAWANFNMNRAETEKLLREILQEQPTYQHVIRFLAAIVLNQGRLEESIAINQKSAALPGGDPLALFNSARSLWQRNRLEEAETMLNASLAQSPFNSALVLKAVFNLTWRENIGEAEKALKQLTGSAFLEDRANFHIGLLRYYQRDARPALEVWRSFPREFYSDFTYNGPKGFLIGLAHELGGQDQAAQLEWRTALKAVEQRIERVPNDQHLLMNRAHLLACLGEKAAASAALDVAVEVSGQKITAQSPMTFGRALIYARLGRIDELVTNLPASLANPGYSAIWPVRLRLDPRLDPARKDPRFVKLIDGAAGTR